jgi:hypothetical protein
MNVNIQVPEIDNPTNANVSIEDKILHVLSIYPRISHSMLQIGLGSSLPTSIWRPILQQLLDTGKVKEDVLVKVAPSGRHQTYVILSLDPNNPSNT